jgi:menaquinone-dependent protoporphyrinogen IX oxidase
MKTIMVYQSTSGYTKRYAEWIGEATKIDVKAFDDVKAKDLKVYDVIVFGAGIYAGRLAKIGTLKKWVQKMPEKQFVVWANGSAPVNDEVMTHVRETNLTENLSKLPLFYGQSGMNFEKMKPLHRFMLNMMVNAASKKDPSELNEDERGIMDAKANPTDHTDQKYIAPLVAYLAGLE